MSRSRDPQPKQPIKKSLKPKKPRHRFGYLKIPKDVRIVDSGLVLEVPNP